MFQSPGLSPSLVNLERTVGALGEVTSLFGLHELLREVLQGIGHRVKQAVACPWGVVLANCLWDAAMANCPWDAVLANEWGCV